MAQATLFQFKYGQKPKPPLKELPTYYFPSKLTNPKRWNVTWGNIYIRSSREWGYQNEIVEAFNVDPELEKRPCALGSYSGGGAHVVNVKHLALELREQILLMLEEGAEPRGIRIFWSPRARELYKERFGKQVVPDFTAREIRKVFVEDVKKSYNIWVDYEHFDPKKRWATQIIYKQGGGHWINDAPLEVYIWHLQKTMKHKKLVVFLDKSRTKGLRSHLNYLLNIQRKTLKDLEKPDWSNHFSLLEQLREDIEYAQNGEVSKKDWQSCVWQGDPDHELDVEEEIIRYSKALGLRRETPNVILQLTLAYQDIISQVDPSKLPEKSSQRYKNHSKESVREIDATRKRSRRDIANWKKILREKYKL